MKNKPFTVGNVREITTEWDNENITYSKMVEMLNDIAIAWAEDKIKRAYTDGTLSRWYPDDAKDAEQYFKDKYTWTQQTSQTDKSSSD